MVKQLAGPLTGIRIIECGVWHAGPGASAIMGDLGAEVIKIEPLEGDPERIHGSSLGRAEFDRPNWNLLFEMSNRNKRGICLDIRTDEGQKVLRQLVKGADVFLTNLRNVTKPKLHIDYESLKEVNPRIIHVNTSGYGTGGPMADVGGYDPMGQAISGMAYISGSDEPIILQRVPLDQLTAITTSFATITALFVRERQGIGQDVHTSLYGAALWMLHTNLIFSSVTGEEMDTSWDRAKNSFSRNTFKCGDGKWVTCSNHPEEKYWEQFCKALGRPDLANDPRYDTKLKRAEVNPELTAQYDAIFASKSREEWLKIMHQHGVLFAPVNRIMDVLRDQQAIINGYLVDFDHPLLGNVRLPGFPVQFGAGSAGPRTAAPGLGEHTTQIMGDLGYDDAAIDDMRRRRIIK